MSSQLSGISQARRKRLVKNKRRELLQLKVQRNIRE
jgi:hypothetical protein